MKLGGRNARWLVAGIGLIPFVALCVAAATGSLGADPPEKILNETGEWALRTLILSLAITPVRRWTGLSGLAPHRRTFGLLAYFYASLHFSSYLVFDLGLDWGELGHSIAERPYITVGFATWLMLTPLALTSTRRAIRRWGRRWTVLHRLAYGAVCGAVIHFLWSVKADPTEPLIYGGLAALLLAARWRPRRRNGTGRKSKTCATLPRPSRDPGEDPA